MESRARPESPSTGTPWWIPVALLTVLLFVLYGRLLLFPGRYVWFDHWDMCQLEIPRAAFIANAIHNGHFPLWDPYIWAGVPVLGSAQPGPVFPLTLLLASLPLENGRISFLALNSVYCLQHLLGAYLAFLFLREIGVAWWAAVPGAVLSSAGGYVGSLPWLDISNAVVCIPAIALFSIRVVRSRRALDSVFLGCGLGFSWLSGHHEVPMITTYALLGFMGWRLVQQSITHKHLDRELARLLVLSLLLGAAISSLQTLPLIEFGRHAKRWVGLPEPIGWNERVPYEIHRRLSLRWQDLFTVLFPGATAESHTTPYLGVAATTLALWALLVTWRSKVTQGLALSAGFSLLYALGANSPLHPLLYSVLPFLDKVRTPTRGLCLFSLAVAALAAIGMQQLVSGRRRHKLFLALTAGVLLAAFLIAKFSGIPLIYGLESNSFQFYALAAAFLLGLCCFSVSSSRLAIVLPAMALVLELATVTSLRVAPLRGAKAVCATDLVDHDSLASSLRTRAKGGRVALEGDLIRTSLGDLYQIDQLSSFVAGIPDSLSSLDFSSARTRQLLNVTISVGGKRLPLGGPPSEIVISDLPGFDQAWVSHSAIRVNSAAELRAKIDDPLVTLRQTALLLQQDVPTLSNAPESEPVSVERPDSDHAILRVTLTSRGVVTLNGADYPGWKATLDGKPTPILQTYGALRGVVANEGTHVIEMAYQPDSVRYGAILSVLGLTAALALGFRFRARPRFMPPRFAWFTSVKAVR